MRVRSCLRVLALLALLPPVGRAEQRRALPPLAIADVTVVDLSGAPARPHVTVVIRDGRIARIQPAAAPIDGGAVVVDGRGKFLIPGLWDMHVHLSWSGPSALPVLIANGVTGVRDMGGRLGQIDDWRTRIAAGVLVGPRIVRAGPILNGKKFNPLQMVVGGPDEARGVVHALAEAGVDFIKVHRRVPRDSYFAIIDEAKRHGLAVVGHIPMTVTPEEASDAGQATLEHTETLFEGTFSAGLKDGELPGAIHRFRGEPADKLFARFVRNKTMVTPTLIAYRKLVEALDPASPPDPHAAYVAASLVKEAAKQTPSAADRAELARTYAELAEVARQMIRDKVTLLAGTDLAGARVPGFTLHEELALFVELGMTPREALRTATATPAALLRANDLGAVAEGKLADLVLLDADPLDDINNTRRIAAVVAAGRLLRRADLDALLREGADMARAN